MQIQNEQRIEELTEELLEKLGRGSPEAVRILETVSSFNTRELRQKLLVFFNKLHELGPTLVIPVLKRIKGAARFLDQEDLEKWIDRCNEELARGEIKRFVDFIRKVNEDDLRQYISPTKMRFAQIASLLQMFLWGISGRELALAPGADSYTDLRTVFLPYGVNRYTSTDGNFFLYKLMTAHNWAQIETGLLTPDLGELDSKLCNMKAPSDIAALFDLFPDRRLARDIYTLLGAYMLETFLLRELPRLWRSAKHVKAGIFRTRPFLCDLTEKTAFVEGIYQFYLAGRVRGKNPKQLKRLLNELRALRRGSSKEILEALFSFYRAAEMTPGEYNPVEPVFFLGKIEPERASEPIRARKAAKKREFEKALSKLLKEGDGKRKFRLADEIDPEREYLVREGLVLELDGELQEIMTREGEKDGWTVVKGEDLNEGEFPVKMDDDEIPEGPEEEEFEIEAGEVRYDEWDFRKGQYRKKWCLLFEQELPPGDGSIVEETLDQYRGFIKDLRKEFECLQPYPRPTKRLKEGDNIDFDAVVELFIDIRAGLPATGENIFSGIKNTERDIAVLFLLDMSNSTSGWVNRTEKEALIILCEGLQSLGDRYGIFGFEGTSRFRCNFYRVKGFDENYSDEVKMRISGMEPRNYTRMGPPLRHAAAILDRVEARKKLLLVLSDGKPEDVGTYTGDYAIEDTRRALLEVKRKGIFPFCITIDKHAKSYIPHMYGEVNYIELDQIKKLPRMMANIYRKLTL